VHRVIAVVFALGAVAAVLSAAGPPRPDPEELRATLAHIGDRVQEYYAHAQSIIALETVRILRQTSDMSLDGHVRRLVYELRVEWTPPSDDGRAAEANVVRQLISVDGRPPKKGDDEACLDPEPVSPEPMVMLLPGKREEYAFAMAGRGRTDGRTALMVDYKSRVKGPADIKWKDQCVSVSLPGWSRGRVWVDESTHDVLRLDEQLVGMFEFPVPRANSFPGGPASLIIERSDSSIRYQAITFKDPDETLMLPRSVDSMSVWRNTGVPRVRITQVFSNYRRFVGDSRIVPNVR
jgi:hypothetical protein